MEWSADRRLRRLRAVLRRVLVASIHAGAALASPVAAHAQRGPEAEEWRPGPRLEAKVRAAIAERWAVDRDRIRLDWGRVRDERLPPADASIRFIGSGAGGAWVVSFEPAAGPALRVRVRAGVEVAVPIAVRDLERETVLRSDDFIYEETVRWGPPEAVPSARPGWVTRRRVAAGQPLTAPAVAPPAVVEAGATVRAEWRNGTVTLTLPVRALGSAALGEPVAVRTENGRRLDAIATGPGLVEIGSLTGRMP